MFEYTYKYSVLVNASKVDTWNYFMNIENLHKFSPVLQSIEGEVRQGSILIGKMKGGKSIKFNIQNIVPFNSYRISVKTFYFNQDNIAFYEEINPHKTQIVNVITVRGFFVPLLRWFLKNGFIYQTEHALKAMKDFENSRLVVKDAEDVAAEEAARD